MSRTQVDWTPASAGFSSRCDAQGGFPTSGSPTKPAVYGKSPQVGGTVRRRRGMEKLPVTNGRAQSNRVEHLRRHQWKKGQSGNPRGRPRRKTFSEILYDVLAEPLPEELRQAIGNPGGLPPGIDKQETLARLVVDTAITTLNVRLLQEILDRLDPKLRKTDMRPEPRIEKEQKEVDLSKLSIEELKVPHKLALMRDAANRE